MDQKSDILLYSPSGVLSVILYAFHHVSVNSRSLYYTCTEAAERRHAQSHRSFLARICVHYRYGDLPCGHYSVCHASDVHQTLRQSACMVG